MKTEIVTPLSHAGSLPVVVPTASPEAKHAAMTTITKAQQAELDKRRAELAEREEKLNKREALLKLREDGALKIAALTEKLHKDAMALATVSIQGMNDATNHIRLLQGRYDEVDPKTLTPDHRKLFEAKLALMKAKIKGSK